MTWVNKNIHHNCYCCVNYAIGLDDKTYIQYLRNVVVCLHHTFKYILNRLMFSLEARTFWAFEMQMYLFKTWLKILKTAQLRPLRNDKLSLRRMLVNSVIMDWARNKKWCPTKNIGPKLNHSTCNYAQKLSWQWYKDMMNIHINLIKTQSCPSLVF